MALVKGTNSYVTVAEADSYFADRLHSETWSGASPTDKEKALITATGLLDQKPWVGEAENELQSLAFPRIGYYYDPKYGRDLDLINTPERVLKATYELALHLLSNDVMAASSTVKSLSVGPISLQQISTSKEPSKLDELISPLLENSGSLSWWRDN